MFFTGVWGLPIGAALGALQLWLLRRQIRLGRPGVFALAGKLLVSLAVMTLVGLCNCWALIFVAAGYLFVQIALMMRYARAIKEEGE